MGISDWSSDVCSSDLGQAVSEGRPGGEVARGNEGGFRQLFRRYDAVMETPALALVGRHDAAGEQQFRSAALPDQTRQDRACPHVAEIGRASCRERVCQYV